MKKVKTTLHIVICEDEDGNQFAAGEGKAWEDEFVEVARLVRDGKAMTMNVVPTGKGDMTDRLRAAFADRDWELMVRTMAQNPGDNGSVESLIDWWGQNVLYLPKG